MTSDPMIAQAVGLLAFGVGITAFWQRDDQRFRMQLTAFSGIICAHFFLMGAPAAGLSAALSGVRTLVSTRTRNLAVMLGFMLVVWLVGLPKVSEPMQLLALIGTTLGTFGLFRLQGVPLRLCMLTGTLCWLAHNIWLGSIGGSLIEVSFLVVNGITMVRLLRGKALAG
jgi:hypothetical protein